MTDGVGSRAPARAAETALIIGDPRARSIRSRVRSGSRGGGVASDDWITKTGYRARDELASDPMVEGRYFRAERASSSAIWRISSSITF